MPTEYEVIETATGVKGKVTGLAFGEEIVTASTAEFGDVVFQNLAKQGNLTNENFTIAEVVAEVVPEEVA